jgi:hypothetical protein
VSEAALRATVRDKLRPFGCLVRVENACESGTPDIVYCLRAGTRGSTAEGWLELKVCGWWASTRRDHIYIPYIESLTKEQVLWHEAWAAVGGRVWTLLRAGQEYLLIKPAVLRLIYERDITARAVRASAVARGGRTMPVGDVLRALCGPPPGTGT